MSTVLCIGGEALHTRHPLLKSAGFDVLTATNECASLAIGRLPTVDAVILDTHSAISDLPGLATELKCMRPSLPVVLVSDLGADDAPQPGIVFDRVLSRLDGHAALLAAIHEVTSNVVSISSAARYSARRTRGESQRLRDGMAEMKMERLREILSRKRTR
jgi:hypothetical protein